MTTITDEFMMQLLPTTKTYTAIILKAGPGINRDNVKKKLPGNMGVEILRFAQMDCCQLCAR